MTIGYDAQAGVKRSSAATFRDFAVYVLAKVKDEQMTENVRR
jgi:hypothetical protein